MSQFKLNWLHNSQTRNMFKRLVYITFEPEIDQAQ